MTYPAFDPELTAVVTGAASGIGLAAARRFAGLGMKVCLADADEDALGLASEQVAKAATAGTDAVMAAAVDVADAAAMRDLAAAVSDDLGPVGVLMNNAVIRDNATTWGGAETWRRVLDVNFLGVLNGTMAFLPGMLERAGPGLVVNVGSKQGITSPPGNPPYNVAKAALKTYTELLAHELRETPGATVTAHLLIPGMTTTGTREHRPGAWWPDQVVDAMMDGLGRGDFYILCPDGEVTAEMDRKRILWAAGDIVEGRPALSRWHDDYKDAFEDFTP